MQSTVRLEIERRFPFAEGKSFGETGAYERLTGKAYYAIDPTEPRLAGIVDLDLAPRNADGLVEFDGDLDIIKPVDLARGNRRLLYEVSNRGNRSLLSALNSGAPGNNPETAEHAGNGFLFERGYTLLWSGWQGEMLPGGGLITARIPEARLNGQPLRGRVRQEFVVDRPGIRSMPVSGAPNVAGYPVLDSTTAILTVREHEQDERVPVPADRWEMARVRVDRDSGAITHEPSNLDLHVKDGFKPGWIYELIYDTEGSRVMALGFVAIRDLVSMLRNDAADGAGQPSPLANSVDRAYAYGASLSARVLREYVYQGYNEDREGRRVFDAMHSHLSGGGRVFFSQRFSQGGRFPRQHEEHSWASERYPFAYGPVPDLFSDTVDSVLKRPATDPLVLHTHSATEYWQRHASTGQVNLRTDEDVVPPDNVRMYYLSSYPHAPAAAGPAHIGQLPPNGLVAAPFLRACIDLMDRWATDGVPPPPNRLPIRADGTLVPGSEALARFPKIPGAVLPAGPSRLPLYDYGPDYDRGFLTQLPPAVEPGREYPIFVAQVDDDGNDAAGLRSPDVAVPLGTYTGWSVRKAGYAEGDLNSLSGSFVPFTRTKAEREASGDPRPSLEERYGSHDGYLGAIDAAVDALVAGRLLLPTDAERFKAAARVKDPFNPEVPLGPLLA